MPKLKRELDIPQLIFLGIANIIGAGIYVVGGLAAGIAGPSVIFSFFLASFVAILTALSIAELSSAISDIGEAYVYSKKAFGKYVGFLVGFIRLLSSIFSTASVAIGFSIYLITFFFPSFNSSNYNFLFFISILAILFSSVLNILGISKMIRLATFLTLFKIFALSFFIILGLNHIINNFDPTKLLPLFPNGIKKTIEASTLAFFAYLGFQTIALASEEAKNPKKNIPLAIFTTVLLCSILYILIILIQICTVDWHELKKINYSLLYVAKKITDNFIINLLITSSALAAMLSVLLTTIYSSSRIAYAIAKDGFLPPIFTKINKKYQTPTLSIIICSVISILVLFFKNLSTLISFVSFGYLLIFLLINLSLIKLKIKKKIKPKFELPFGLTIPLISSIFIILLLLFLENEAKILAFLSLVGISVFYFLVTKRK